MAFLPNTVDRATRIVLMLSLSWIYNTMRGISVCGFLPWVYPYRAGKPAGRISGQGPVGWSAGRHRLPFRVGIAPEPGRLVLVRHRLRHQRNVGLYEPDFSTAHSDVPVEKITINPVPIPWRDMFFIRHF